MEGKTALRTLEGQNLGRTLQADVFGQESAYKFMFQVVGEVCKYGMKCVGSTHLGTSDLGMKCGLAGRPGESGSSYPSSDFWVSQFQHRLTRSLGLIVDAQFGPIPKSLLVTAWKQLKGRTAGQALFPFLPEILAD